MVRSHSLATRCECVAAQLTSGEFVFVTSIFSFFRFALTLGLGLSGVVHTDCVLRPSPVRASDNFVRLNPSRVPAQPQRTEPLCAKRAFLTLSSGRLCCTVAMGQGRFRMIRDPCLDRLSRPASPRTGVFIGGVITKHGIQDIARCTLLQQCRPPSPSSHWETSAVMAV